MKLSYFPQIKVVHTSKTFHGQLYVPLVNWILMVGTVLVAAIYNNTTSLGNAYGYAPNTMFSLLPQYCQSRSQYQSLRHVRDFLRHLHGILSGHVCMAY
jgi:K+ transporter